MRSRLPRRPWPASPPTAAPTGRRVLPLAAVSIAVALGASGAAAPPPPDLLLEWSTAASVKGSAGTTVNLEYRVRNVGGQDAFAVLLRAYSALGPLHRPVRLQPGPRPGAAILRVLAVPLATGMREVCVEAGLQNLRLEDPPDSTPDNNRICRAVVVAAPAAGESEPPDPRGST